MTRWTHPPLTLLQRSHMWVLALILSIMALSGCSRPTTLERIQQENALHLIIQNAPSVYYEGSEGPAGFEYELARLFAEHLGVELRVRTASDSDEIYSVLNKGYTHLAAGAFVLSDPRHQAYLASPAFTEAQSVVVHRAGTRKPNSLEDLAERKLAVAAGSRHERRLQALRQTTPTLTWQSQSDVEATDLFQQLDAGDWDAVVVDTGELAMYQAFFPKVRKAFELGEPDTIGWLLPAGEDRTLHAQLERFLNQATEDGTLDALRERYFGHMDRLGYVGARTFVHHMRNRLPKYEASFKTAAEQFGQDWKLLAALGYQESHWKHDAISPTGVQGLMMLTRSTARHVGVSDRTDPFQSIRGGAKYLAELMEKMPEDIVAEDRMWFALASYNVGFGHVLDARKLARNLGKDPSRWDDVQSVLPLLSQKKWYSQTRHGYARGHEPVMYVQNIRRYYDVIDWMTNSQAASIQAPDDAKTSATNSSVEGDSTPSVVPKAPLPALAIAQPLLPDFTPPAL